MQLRILKYLACPHCRSERTSSARFEEGEIDNGVLVCRDCTAQYPVVNGIPRFVTVDENNDQDIETGSRFSQSWHRFARFHDIYQKQFFDWLAPVNAQFLENKIVLDAGCGKGRHSRIVAEIGAAEVFAVDIGNSVNVAAKNLCHLKNAHVIQADIKKLPFKRCLDFAYSTGVLHHMAEPREGFRSVLKHVKPTGAISVWLYGKENNGWITSIVSPLRIAITSRMPSSVLSALSYILALIVITYARLIAYPASQLRIKFKYIPKVFYESYLAYISRFDLEEIHHIVFDHLVTPVAYYLNRKEVTEWFKEPSFVATNIRWHNENSWSCVGSFDPSDASLLGLAEVRPEHDKSEIPAYSGTRK